VNVINVQKLISRNKF